MVSARKNGSRLESNRIRFEQYDSEKDVKAAEKMRALGGPGGVPYAIPKGQSAYGLSEDLYNQVLGLR